MRSVESLELDDNCGLFETFYDNQWCSNQVIRLTHIRISFWCFKTCLDLLEQLGQQLHLFSVTIGCIGDKQSELIPKIRSVSNI
jgi:hypothetical protein